MAEPTKPRPPDLQLPELIPADAARIGRGEVREAELLSVDDVPELDWSRTTIRECDLALSGVGALVLDRARLLGCRLQNPNVTNLRGRDATWRVVQVASGRLAALELAGSVWDGVRVTGTRLGYVNLRDASLTDVVLSGCRIETLDLGAARARRVSLDGCTIEELLVPRATLTDVDLRGTRIDRIEGVAHLAGATISTEQLLDLAPALAAEFGINLG